MKNGWQELDKRERRHLKDSLIHREDGPAWIVMTSSPLFDGHKYMSNGRLHRLDGISMYWWDTVKRWDIWGVEIT